MKVRELNTMPGPGRAAPCGPRPEDERRRIRAAASRNVTQFAPASTNGACGPGPAGYAGGLPAGSARMPRLSLAPLLRITVPLLTLAMSAHAQAPTAHTA